jgi:signal transduction histidine kinase/CheY-like chemotaxis protein
MMAKEKLVPDWTFAKWQGITDLLAKIIKIPAALIMYNEDDYMEVVVASNSSENPYKKGDRENWEGLYCERVIRTQKRLIVANALKDKDWDKNPDLALGMVAYIGFPINFPDGSPFGTLCLLDTKENNFNISIEGLIQNLTEVIEKDLSSLLKYNKSEVELNNKLRKQNKELKRLKEKAEESNRLKTEFLHNLSHEIRTPMNGIIGFADLLNKNDINPSEKKLYTSIIKESSEKLQKTIEDIIEISSLETSQITISRNKFCLNDLLYDIKSDFISKCIDKRIELKVRLGAEDSNSYIRTDKNKLRKTIECLVDNSIKFTTEGYIEIGYKLKEQKIHIYVKDTGMGISKDYQKIIFKRFTHGNNKLSKSNGGLGLGLSISQAYIELMKGEIKFKSSFGKGSKFNVIIPYKPIQHKKISNPKPKLSSVCSCAKVLIAEDEQINFMLLEAALKILKGVDFKILHAKNGREAIDLYMDNKDLNMILMDIKMPELNGNDATKKIKSINPNIPIIAQTAYANQEDIDNALKLGYDNVITKPINKEKLHKVVLEHLDKSRFSMMN